MVKLYLNLTEKIHSIAVVQVRAVLTSTKSFVIVIKCLDL